MSEDDITKKIENLQFIIAHGSDFQKKNALDKIVPLIQSTGDIWEAVKFLENYKGKRDTKLRNLVENTANIFLDTLSLNPTNPTEYANKIIATLSKPNPRELILIDSKLRNYFTLYSVMRLYAQLSEKCESESSLKSNYNPVHDFHFMFDSKLGQTQPFREISLVFEAMSAAISVKTNNTGAFKSKGHKDIESALDVFLYIDSVKKHGYARSEYNTNTLKTLASIKLNFSDAYSLIKKAEDGYSKELEEESHKKNSETAIFARALIPCAALIKLGHTTAFDLNTNGNLRIYNPKTDFERKSEVYRAVQKYSPLLALMRMKDDMDKGKFRNPEYLLEIKNIAESTEMTYRYAGFLLDNYVNSIAKKEEINGTK